MRRFPLKTVLAGLVTAAGLIANGARAADPATHPLSRDHVNLVRVQGQKITDVVYDTQALEVSADKERGIVFIKVKTAWLASGAGEVTSAFFNTESENFSVQFFVSAVPSQTVDLIPQTSVTGAADDRQTRIALAAPLLKLESGDFVSELKTLVQKSVTGQVPDETLAVGSLASREDDRRFARLPASEGAVYWEGFKVRETQAFLSADKLTETLLFTRVSAKAGVPDAARLARIIGGVLAVAQEVQGSGDRLQTEITVIRSREAATRGGDVFESALVALSGAVSTSKRESKLP